MKLSIGLQRKCGLPEYSSVGADCHVELDLDPLVTVHDLTRFQAICAEAFRACSMAVDEELARQVGRHGVPSAAPRPAPEPAREPEPEPARNGTGYRPEKERREWASRRPAPEPGPERRNYGGGGSSRKSRTPERGDQLFPWVKEKEENGEEGLTQFVIDWGKSVGLRGQMKSWPPDAVRDAVQAVLDRING